MVPISADSYPSSRVHRPHPQGREASGPSDPNADQSSSSHQPKTAKALDLDVPMQLQQRADELIEWIGLFAAVHEAASGPYRHLVRRSDMYDRGDALSILAELLC